MRNLSEEQLSSLNRPRMKYSLPARLFFLSMDIFTGKKTTLAKAKLIETLASIPYREWELRKYFFLTRRYTNPDSVRKAMKIMTWSRNAQDNEYWHLLVLHEKMREDTLADPWYLAAPIRLSMALAYIIFARVLSFISLKHAYYFNAQFEDHAEHVYAAFLRDNPQLNTQPVTSALVKEYADLPTWGDIIRRIGLDERDHRNNSLRACGRNGQVAEYPGMPASEV